MKDVRNKCLSNILLCTDELFRHQLLAENEIPAFDGTALDHITNDGKDEHLFTEG